MAYQHDPTKIAARANQLKSELIAFLGGQCEECGATTDLEPNHIYQRTWRSRELTHYRRVLRYWKEARAGLLNCLCKECNRHYRPMPRPPASSGADQLF